MTECMARGKTPAGPSCRDSLACIGSVCRSSGTTARSGVKKTFPLAAPEVKNKEEDIIVIKIRALFEFMWYMYGANYTVLDFLTELEFH